MEVESNIVLIVMKYLIVAIALLMAYAEIRQAIRMKGVYGCWVKWGLGLMGLYWAFYYTRSIVGIELGMTHQIWVRSPLLLTLALVAAGATISLRRIK